MDLIIYNRDSTKDMAEIETASVDLILTSPPYWNIKNYDNRNQLGLGLTYEHFIYMLKKNLIECMRVLKEDRLAIFIVGDVRTIAGYGGRATNSRPRVFSIQSEIIQYFNEMGFDTFAHLIWHKTSVKKGRKCNLLYGAVKDNYIYPPFIYTDLSIEHILIFRKPGDKRELLPLKERGDGILKETIGDWLNPIWNIEPSRNDEHPATFPPELVKRLILMFSLRNDIVLDPFCGTGTTLEQAIQLDRKSIGYEINERYLMRIINKYKLKCEGIKYYSSIYP